MYILSGYPYVEKLESYGVKAKARIGHQPSLFLSWVTCVSATVCVLIVTTFIAHV